MARSNTRDAELLSLPACRRLLGHVGDSLSDAEVLRPRDQPYAVAECAVAAFAEDAADQPEATVLGSFAPDARDEIEERAAIIQYDAHVPRGLATRAAVAARVTGRENGR